MGGNLASFTSNLPFPACRYQFDLERIHGFFLQLYRTFCSPIRQLVVLFLLLAATLLSNNLIKSAGLLFFLFPEANGAINMQVSTLHSMQW